MRFFHTRRHPPVISVLILTMLVALSTVLSCTTQLDDGEYIPFLDELGGTSGQHFEDAAGDNFGIEVFQYDILSIDLYIDESKTYLIMHMTFNNPVYAPFPVGNMEGLVGYLEVDADQNPLTGSTSIIDGFAIGQGEPPTNMGVEYGFYFFEYDSIFHTMPIRKPGTLELTGYANIVYNGNTCTLQIPLGAMGDDDGNIDFGFILGTTLEPTDMAYTFSYNVE
jgi:hypothetical protein